MLAALLDFGASANAAFDHKKGRRQEWRVIMHFLEEGETGMLVPEYLRRLAKLESGRPLPGGDRSRFQEVCLYREAVVRLSLGLLAAAAFDNQSLDGAIVATYGNGDLNLLFRIVMQCQILDDILDYSQDSLVGLPSFLTACSSPRQALDLTRHAVSRYAKDRSVETAGELFPLGAALFFISILTKLIVTLRRTLSAGVARIDPTAIPIRQKARPLAQASAELGDFCTLVAGVSDLYECS